MKITLNDLTEEALDRAEDAFADLVNVHTTIWEGSAKDTYTYEIEIDDKVFMRDYPLTGKDYSLVHATVLYKAPYYTIEIMNESQIGTVDIKATEIQSILLK